jgi:hypothetical protein
MRGVTLMMCAAETPPNRKFGAPLRAVTFLGSIYQHGATGLMTLA